MKLALLVLGKEQVIEFLDTTFQGDHRGQNSDDGGHAKSDSAKAHVKEHHARGEDNAAEAESTSGPEGSLEVFEVHECPEEKCVDHEKDISHCGGLESEGSKDRAIQLIGQGRGKDKQPSRKENLGNCRIDPSGPDRLFDLEPGILDFLESPCSEDLRGEGSVVLGT